MKMGNVVVGMIRAGPGVVPTPGYNAQPRWGLKEGGWDVISPAGSRMVKAGGRPQGIAPTIVRRNGRDRIPDTCVRLREIGW